MKRIYTFLLFVLFVSASHSQPVAGLSEATVAGLSAGDGEHTFHFYTADGKLVRGYSEVFIVLTDKDGHWVEDFTVSNFTPIMNMGMSQHSTPVGQVEKVAGKPLYKTWFAFLMHTGQMDGAWTLNFDYSIGSASGKITGASPQVDAYPANAKWIQAFTCNSENYYLTLVAPQSLTEGSQTVQAYINKQEDALQPYPVVEGGFKIEITPWMAAMNHGSSGNTPLEWNVERKVYEGTLNLGMEGDWRIYLQVLDADADTVIAGAAGTESTLYWDVQTHQPAGLSTVTTAKAASVYPTLSKGEITVKTQERATISVIDIAGKTLASYLVGANEAFPVGLNYPNGLYLVAIENEKGITAVHKVILQR
jgi:hypothetical protein